MTTSDPTTLPPDGGPESPVAGYVDYKFSILEQIPFSPEKEISDVARRAIEIAATAVGQLVVARPGGTIKRNDKNQRLRIPARVLRHQKFLGGLPLYQDICFKKKCPDECESWDLNPYFDEHLIDSFATASVFMQRNWIITAYHAIDPSAISKNPDPKCKQTYFVFGRNHQSNIATPRGRRLRVPAANYRRCRRIIKSGKCGADSGYDWAIIELDHDVPSHAFPLQTIGDPERDSLPKKETVFVLQHPLGLPLKYSKADTKEDDDDKAGPRGKPEVRTDLGAGSSGSPILHLSDCSAKLFGVIGGGRVNFEAKHLRPTKSGTVIDPSLGATDDDRHQGHTFTLIGPDGGIKPS